ncbi:MAG TPA: GDP-mannose 4,6-dehydratase [Terriglobales bacterium]|nr:GDP-mannose 4,6-dehydratase [Terriglobales bacterium]
MKRALVTGVTGQGGAHLSRFLVEKGYRVYGGCRRMGQTDLWRLQELGLLNHQEFSLLEYDATDPASSFRLMEASSPDEIYHMAAQAHVGRSFELPHATALVTGVGALNMLEAMRKRAPAARFLQASSAELFGNTAISPQSEATPFKPRSPYGAAKLFAYSLAVTYCEAFRLFASNAILFNYESPLRSTEFVTRKITTGVAALVVHGRGPLLLGNLAAKRDWGSAKEYVDGMWRILHAPSPDAFVLATGRTETVRTFVNIAYATQGIELEWENSGKEERAVCRRTGKTIVAVDEAYYRPAEVEALIGDASKAAHKLGWVPCTGLEAIVEEMVVADIRRAKAALQ